MATQPIYDMTDTWSQAGTKHTAIKMDVMDAASTADSALLDLQIGGNTRILGGKDGSLTLAGVVRPVRAAIASLPPAATAGEGAVAYATGEGGGLVVSDGTSWKPLAIEGAGSNAAWKGPALAVANGGTGASNAVAARSNLNLGNVDNTSDVNKPISEATRQVLALKANLASPVLTGTPRAPTPASTSNDTTIATTAFVKAQGGNIPAKDPTFTDSIRIQHGSSITTFGADANISFNSGTFYKLYHEANPPPVIGGLWQTKSFARDTAFQNATGKTIVVSQRYGSGTGVVQGSVSSTANGLTNSGSTQAEISGPNQTMYLIVPAGHFFSFSVVSGSPLSFTSKELS